MRLRAVFATKHEYIANGLGRKRCRYLKSIGDHGQILFACQFEREYSSGRPSVDHQGFTILDELGRALPDAGFLWRSTIDPLRDRGFPLGKAICGNPPAVGPPHETPN